MNQHEKSPQPLSHTLANYNVTWTENISTKYLGTEALVYIGDDGGYCFFFCELPVTRRGEIIDIGFWYELSFYDAVLVTGKKLVKRGEQFTWFFEAECYEDNGTFSSEELLMVYEFKRLINHGCELIQVLNNNEF